MDSVFTLSYPEQAVAEELAACFSKYHGFSVSVPLSRQQKGHDLLVYHRKTRKSVTFQVKSSRYYRGSYSTRAKRERFRYNLWFRSIADVGDGADYFILFGLYPRDDVVSRRLQRARSPHSWWNHVMLVFSNAQMKELMLKTKPDKFFGFGLHYHEGRVFLTRGVPVHEDVSHFIFTAVIPEIRSMLETASP